jgi:23S rRNA pseudouridine2457 synthase
MLIAFNKPFGVLSQFTPDGSKHRTLAEFGFPKHAYPIGRLDAASEGLLLLSDEPFLNQRLLAPINAHTRTYWAQIERLPEAGALAELERGVLIGKYRTLPCRAWLLNPQPLVPPRNPPVRYRKNIPDCWIALSLIEGKNHQVRRMTAAIGHPTLRLIRVRIGELDLAGLPSGQWRELGSGDRARVFAGLRTTDEKRPPAKAAPPRPGKRRSPSR